VWQPSVGHSAGASLLAAACCAEHTSAGKKQDRRTTSNSLATMGALSGVELKISSRRWLFNTKHHTH
jgi:hypothetical protein